MRIDEIKINKAKVHNLKSVTLSIPKNKLVVITGPSGSGKSSLAFDTLYIEGQRRYIESLSSYARQFLGQFQAPDVESISGLSPAIAIDQKSVIKNPRSTVGTTTEIYDYLRVLFSKVGTKHCPSCKGPVSSQSPSQISKNLLNLKKGTKVQILSPVIRSKKGTHKEQLSKFLSMGINKVRVNGKIEPLSEDIKLDKNLFHNIDIILDRLILRDGVEGRLHESVEMALKFSGGFLYALADDKELMFSESNFCIQCNINFPDIDARSFSFNSPLGACEECSGIGEKKDFTPSKIIFDEALPILEGGVPLLSKGNTFLRQMVSDFFKFYKIKNNQSFKSLKKDQKDKLLFGNSEKIKFSFSSENSNFNFSKEFPGIINWISKKYRETKSEKKRADLEEFMDISTCRQCEGKRLNQFSLGTLINKKNIFDLSDLAISDVLSFMNSLEFQGERKKISEKIISEINSRLVFLNEVGLGYLNLNRGSTTLSGGESQRIRLATQIGSSLSGVLYVLDEPSIGLHPSDNLKLIKTIQSLRDLGNSVIVVEHDEETMLAADHIIDIGPGAGYQGGEIIFSGSPDDLLKAPNSLTAQYLNGYKIIPTPSKRRVPTSYLEITSANKNNISNQNLKIPLGLFLCVTGVSGSGKSTLVHEIMIKGIKHYHDNKSDSFSNLPFKRIKGAEKIESIISLDQSPIGRTPRSNPITYIGAFDDIRKIYANTPESKVRGYKAGRFSFNVKGGRCESCQGDGQKRIEMHFLPDVFVTCEECNGSRYNPETLKIHYKGKSISDVFQMTCNEAYDFFTNYPPLKRKFKTMIDVGLGYMKLGQPSTTLSGGEAQRIKLSKELSKTPRGHCLYVLDEPTTGLHFNDVALLIKSLASLVEKGHSLVVIEHDLNVIKSADYIVDMGPSGGSEGGLVVAEGTPEELSRSKNSMTAKFLLKELRRKEKG